MFLCHWQYIGEWHVASFDVLEFKEWKSPIQTCTDLSKTWRKVRRSEDYLELVRIPEAKLRKIALMASNELVAQK